MSKESAFEVGRLYLPIRQIADVLTSSQKDVFVRLPGLLSYWPMGIRSQGIVIDHSGSGKSLTQVGTNQTGFDGNSFIHLGNGVNYLTSASAGLGVTGTETWIVPSLRGLTVGGWVMIDATPAGAGGVLSRSADTPDRGYVLAFDSSNTFAWLVSGTGAAVVQVNSAATQISQWVFVAARYTPSTEIAVIVNADKTVNTTAVPASLNVSAQPLELGRYFAADANILHCKQRDMFVCAAALSDEVIETIRTTSTP